MKTLFGQPTPRVVAELALHYLQQAQSGAGRLAIAHDSEALHDARVGLRRLYTLMRAYQSECGAEFTNKLCRRVRKLVRRSNRARDQEVQAAWLLGQGKGLGPAQRAGYLWLQEQLQAEGEAGLQQALIHGTEKLQHKLAKPLLRLAARGGPPFAVATAQHASAIAGELLQNLTAIEGVTDIESAHAARIKVKCLRYLLAPLRAEVAACTEVTASLQQLQDLLGELHDRQLFSQWLRHALAQIATSRAEQLFDEAQDGTVQVRAGSWQAAQAPGVLAVAARNRADMLQCFSRLQQEYLSRLHALEGQLHYVVAQLEASVKH